MSRHLVLLGAGLAFAAAVAAQPSSDAPPDRMETLVVRAAREPIRFESLGSAASVIGAEALRRRQQAPLGEILRAVPGLSVSRVGVMGSQTQLRLRGSEANHVLVLIDGIRANDPAQNDEFNIAHVLNHGIEAVEVIRGPQSALWGSDALAGVINIRTAGDSRGNRGAIFAETGSNGWAHYGASGAFSTDRLRGRVSVNSVDTDGENISREGNERDGYENLSVNLAVAADLSEALRVSGTLRFTEAANDFDGTDFSTGLPSDRDNRSDVQQLFGQLRAELDTLDGRWNHRLYYNTSASENRNRSENPFATAGFDSTEANADIRVLGYQSNFSPTRGQRLTAALERQEQDFRQRGPVSFFGDPNRDESIAIDSLVLEYALELDDGLSLLIGARRDANSDFRDSTTGRASAAWQPFGAQTGTRLRASVGTGVKNPTFTERFGFFTNFVGNPELRPEASRAWDIGLDQQLLNGALDLGLTWFDSTLEDEINGFVFDPAAGGFTATNEDGRSDRQGLELEGRWQLNSTLQLAFAYTWLDATEDSGSETAREIRRPRHSGNLGLNWVFASGRGNLNVNADYNGVQDDVYFPPVPPFRERVELDSFTLVTVAGSYQVTGGLQLFARVENALDEGYEEVFGFRGMGRSAYAGVRYRFGP